MNAAAISDFFKAAIGNAPTERAFLVVLATFAVLFLVWMLRNGFDFRASFRPITRTRKNTRPRKSKPRS